MCFCVLEHAHYAVLSLLLDLPQFTFTAEPLGIDLVNILRAGRPSGKPAVRCDHLNSTERKTVPWRGGKLRAYWLAGKFHHIYLIGRERLSPELIVCFAWVPLGLCGDFGGKQTENYPFIVVQTDPPRLRNDAPALSLPAKPSEPPIRPSTNHLNPTGISTSLRPSFAATRSMMPLLTKVLPTAQFLLQPGRF